MSTINAGTEARETRVRAAECAHTLAVTVVTTGIRRAHVTADWPWLNRATFENATLEKRIHALGESYPADGSAWILQISSDVCTRPKSANREMLATREPARHVRPLDTRPKLCRRNASKAGRDVMTMDNSNSAVTMTIIQRQRVITIPTIIATLTSFAAAKAQVGKKGSTSPGRRIFARKKRERKIEEGPFRWPGFPLADGLASPAPQPAAVVEL